MLFSKTISRIEFNQTNDLKAVVEHLKDFTFQEKDDSERHEFFSLYIYLMGCFKLKKLLLPVKIISRESPDFIIVHEDQEKEIGFEHTRGTLESFKIAESKCQKRPEGSVIELCYYSPFANIPKKQSDIGKFYYAM